jgi:hypothetical protein
VWCRAYCCAACRTRIQTGWSSSRRQTVREADRSPSALPGTFDYREQARQFEGFAAGFSFLQTLDSLQGVGAEQVDGSIVTANFFPLLEVSPVRGRNFLPEEEVVNGPRVAIIGYDLWRRRYAADPKLVGAPIRMNGQDFTVIGILPPGFKLYLPSDRLFLKLTAAGLATGVLLSLAVSRVISSQLFEVKATDLATYILTPAVLAFVAMLASYFPRRRAAKLDPMDALRYDGQ